MKDQKFDIYHWLVPFLGALVFALVVNLLLNPPQEQKNEHLDQQNEWVPVDGLPKLVDVDPEQQPLLYDAMNGTIGWHFDGLNVPSMDPFFVVAVKPGENAENHGVFVSFYNWAEVMLEPPLGTGLQRVGVDQSKFDVIIEWMSNMDKSYLFNEGEWTVAFVNSIWMPDEKDWNQVDENGNWAGMNLSLHAKSTIQSPGYENVYINGFGFDTEWFRKPMWKNVCEKAGMNIQNEFWDRFRLHQVVKLVQKDKPDDPVAMHAEVVGYNMFCITERQNLDGRIHVNLYDLEELCAVRGYIMR